MEQKEKKFEDKMKELEVIINDLENGNGSLEESIDKYTRAMKLVTECDRELKNVKEQVSKMVLEDGTLKDFNIEETNNQ